MVAMQVPSSINEQTPVQTNKPPRNQTTMPVAGLGTLRATWEGVRKMPEPIWRPRTRETPLRKVRAGFLWGAGVVGEEDEKEEEGLWSRVGGAVFWRGCGCGCGFGCWTPSR